ncbi:MAG: imidazoleglycerol-phosphate dehydratase HisB [Chitinispirillia bacterium]|nr:imidazoleglycerol-phosphate dehydratase HisB [Chitinispirillia bacterium]MCL2241158.1 imidazoleglycerol-phosphate dehydratase HisB [Chitinispirillia bacterium]
MREANVVRTTKETDISLDLTIDGDAAVDNNIQSGNGFMDHMLALFARHGLFNLSLACNGDTHVDFHHSAEDIGICLGQAFREALGDMRGIRRYGSAHVPMDESLARVCLDISGRPNLIYSVPLTDRRINDFECDLAEDFFKSFCDHCSATVHIDLLRGRNSHHSLEAVFKAFGRALSEACEINARAADSLPSTKGVI